MRTPNTKCVICNKPLYRRPLELSMVNLTCCAGCQSTAYKQFTNQKILDNLELGHCKGINHLNRIPKSKESNMKRSQSHKIYWANHATQLKERGKKIQGEKHYRWNGGVSKLNASIRLMTENRRWQDAVKARDKICLECGDNHNLESHHLTSISELLKTHNITNRNDARNCPELWDLSNGKTLCMKCHYKLHGRIYAD